MDSKSFSGFDTEKFKRSHVPLTALGRFFVDDALPASCQRIVYIDGDTWIRRDPSPLIEATVPDGKLAAVEDMLSFRSNEPSPYARGMRDYMKRLGVNPKNGYFNSGLFAASRKTWRTLAPEAYKFISENTEACELHDQSALNAVTGDRRLKLSLKWNFQTSYKYSGMERFVDPCVYHFTRSPKPWMGICRPWEEMYKPYHAALAPFAKLNLPIKSSNDQELAAHNQLNRRKNLLLKFPPVAKLFAMQLGIGAHEKHAWL